MTLFLLKMMGFDAYGVDSMTEPVKKYLGWQAWAIVVQFVLDWYLWTALFGIALGDSPMSYVFGMAMAFVIAVLEVTIVVQDTTEGLRRVAMLFVARIAMMFVMSAFTSTVFDLKFFHDSIDRQITREEKVDADAIRGEAIAGVTADYVGRLTDKKAVLDGQPEAIKSIRSTDRATLVATQKESRADITKRLKGVMDDAARESAGKGLSGRRGAGVTTGLLTKQSAEIRTELKDFDAAAKVELAEFDAETARQQSDAVTGGEAAGDAVLAERDAKVAAIRALSQEELGAAYPGDWVRSRGVLDQYRTLNKLIESDPVNAFVAYMLWVLGMIIPVVLLILKFAAPAEVRNYFSKKSQAGSGDAKAEKQLRHMGYTGSISQLGWSDEAVGWHRAVSAKRIELRERLVEFGSWFHRECSKDSSTQLCSTREALTRSSVSQWNEKVGKTIRELSDVEAQARVAGMEVQPWPSDWEIEDPRVDTDRVWNASDEDLEREYCWANPVVPRLVHAGPKIGMP